jgi:hypothetical protein
MSIFRLDFVTTSTEERDHITEHYATFFAMSRSDTKQAGCEAIVFSSKCRKGKIESGSRGFRTVHSAEIEGLMCPIIIPF